VTGVRIRREWVLGVGLALVWLVIIAAGVQFLVRQHQRLFPPPPSLPQATFPRGRILSADGAVLATSPRPGTRLYPLKTLAGQVVGYTTRANGRYGEGLEGVEVIRELDLKAGRDVELTLDARVQAIAEEALAWGMARAKARWGAVVVLAPDGRVLAAANAPFFDPQSPRGKPEEDPRLKNYAFVEPIEPGSVIKPITAAVVLEEGAASPEEAIPVPPVLRIKNQRVRDWRWHPTERWTLADILKASSNVGITLFARRLEPKTLHAYFEALGFGRAELVPGFAGGTVLDPPERWTPIRFANLAFGQGLAITTLHLAAAYGALVDGVYRTPRLFADEEAEAHRVFSQQTVKTVVKMLAEGLVPTAELRGYRLAGKTGTAQIAQGGRYTDRVSAVFAGLVPAKEPIAVVAVVFYDPQVPANERFGSKLAAPVFRRVAAGLLSLFGVPPERANLR